MNRNPEISDRDFEDAIRWAYREVAYKLWTQFWSYIPELSPPLFSRANYLKYQEGILALARQGLI